MTRSAAAAEGKNAIKTVTSAGKGKRSSVETKYKGQSSKGQEASSESSGEEGQDYSSENESRSQLRRLRMSWMLRMLNVRLSK